MKANRQASPSTAETPKTETFSLLEAKLPKDAIKAHLKEARGMIAEAKRRGGHQVEFEVLSKSEGGELAAALRKAGYKVSQLPHALMNTAESLRDRFAGGVIPMATRLLISWTPQARA